MSIKLPIYEVFLCHGAVHYALSRIGSFPLSLCKMRGARAPPLTPPLGGEVEGGESLTPHILPWCKVNVHRSWGRGEGGGYYYLTPRILPRL